MVSNVARHLDGNIDLRFIAQNVNPTRRVGRPRINAPGHCHQPPAVIPVDHLTGLAIMPVAGTGLRPKREKRGTKVIVCVLVCMCVCVCVCVCACVGMCNCQKCIMQFYGWCLGGMHMWPKGHPE